MAENISRRKAISMGLGLGVASVLGPLDTGTVFAQVEASPVVKMNIIKPSDSAVSDIETNRFQAAIVDVRDWYLKKIGATFNLREGVQVIDLPLMTSAQILAQGDEAWQTALKAVNKGALATRKNTVDVIVMLGGSFPGQGGTWSPDGSSGYLVLGNPAYRLINKQDSGIEWLNTYNHALAVVAHELGHSFGLPHPDPSEGDLKDRIMAGDIGAFPDQSVITESEKSSLLAKPFFRKV